MDRSVPIQWFQHCTPFCRLFGVMHTDAAYWVYTGRVDVKKGRTLCLSVYWAVLCTLYVLLLYDVARLYGQKTIQYWVGKGDVGEIRRYVTNGGNVHIDVLGYNLLMIAVDNEHYEVAKLLIDAGVDPNETPGIFSPLRLAVRRNSEMLVQLLLENGADPNWTHDQSPHWSADTATHTAFDDALYRENKKIIELLLEHGAKVEDLFLYWVQDKELQDTLRAHANRQEDN